ncbi:MAG: RHS repeat-associated core domain-containing protein [Planctomycetes bacterium]|nr:RHS repeat-associated core domain-containing protein [Planctomycetota bacterium]
MSALSAPDGAIYAGGRASHGLTTEQGRTFGSSSAVGTGTTTHTLTGTPERPFWSLVRKGWVARGEEQPGEQLLLASGQPGTWTSAATPPSQQNGETDFKLDAYAAMNQYMVGWGREATAPQERIAFRGMQPDVNHHVYLPITGVSGNTVSVRGNYAALGQAGTNFRVYAPPGVERRGGHAGTLSRWVSAESSRCLYGGYRYESPLAGFEAGTTTTPAAECRQTGPNFGGLHYTLHRHYDPVQMRFTGPDPAASPFHNLHAYCGNNPAAFFDPDGLARKKSWSNETFTADLIESGLDIFEGVLMKTFGGMATVGASGFQMLDGEHIGDTFVGQGVQDAGRRHRTRSAQNGGGLWGYLNGAGGTISDTFGFTGISESISGRDNITGQQLSSHERYERFVDGASSGIAFAIPVVGGAKFRSSVKAVHARAALPQARTLPMRGVHRELAPGPHRAQIQYLKALRMEARITSRVSELNRALPAGSRGRVTMAVGVVEAPNGLRSVLVGTSEPRGYLRPGVELKPGEFVVPGTGHAEANIVAHANRCGFRVISIGATKRVCPNCQEVIGSRTIIQTRRR